MRGLHARLLVAASTLLLACGSRTGLELSPRPADASTPLDASPLLDASPPPEACAPLDRAYVLDAAGVLHRYDPLTGQHQALGTPNCGNGNVQWTMTVGRDKAYIVYTDWTIYAVSLATLACTPTPFRYGQLGIEGEFGVAVTGSGASERLFVYGLPSGSERPILAVSDTSSFVLTKVGDILPAPPVSSFPVNLTADPTTGNLYAFSPGGFLQKIDSATGAILDSVDSGVTSQSTWATISDGPDLFLWVEGHVDGYDLASRTRTGDRNVGIFAIGAGSIPACP